jgi:poly(A) polymerase
LTMIREKISVRLFDIYFKKRAKDLAFLKESLENRGHCLYFVGGCVRDALRDVAPKDYDLTTSAPADAVELIIRDNNHSAVNVGLDHGTVGFFKGNEFYEITTFRQATGSENLWERTEFSEKLYEDSLGRDLTINALYLDFDGTLIDWHGGIKDIESQVVRFVGDPHSRIKEDYLRILRYFRFATLFSIVNFDDYSFQAATDVCNLEGLRKISRERIREELFRIAAAKNAKQIFQLMIESDVLEKCDLNIYDQDIFLEKISIDLIAAFASQANIETVKDLSKSLVLSIKERNSLAYLVKSTERKKQMIDCLIDYHHHNVKREDIIRFLKYTNKDVAKFLRLFTYVPPYDGNYVQESYGLHGREVGRELLVLRKNWLEVLLENDEEFKGDN